MILLDIADGTKRDFDELLLERNKKGGLVAALRGEAVGKLQKGSYSANIIVKLSFIAKKNVAMNDFFY